MPQQTSDCVRAAHASLRMAAQVCGGTDVNGIERVSDLLETAVAAMRQAEAEVRSAMPNDRAELRREIVLLKREIACVMRVIDGCSALYRGLAVRLGVASPSYTPMGNSVAPSPFATACELQG